MTRALLTKVLIGWFALTAVLSVGTHHATKINPIEPPSQALREWALSALDGARSGVEIPPPPSSYTAAGPIFVHAWDDGLQVARIVAGPDLEQAVRSGAAALIADEGVTSRPGWRSGGDDRTRFTLTVTLGEGPLLLGVQALSHLGVVPFHEGIGVRANAGTAYLTPSELIHERAFDHGVPTPIPELKLGMQTDALVDRLVRELDLDAQDERDAFRFRAHTLAEHDYPREEAVTEENLRNAAKEGASFLIRHQDMSGKWTYLYDARSDRTSNDGYSIARHSGTAYFMAQVNRFTDHPEAGAATIRALEWLRTHKTRRCGENRCLESYGRADVGSAALTVIAASELLAKDDTVSIARQQVVELTAFLRSLQREDGELMHEFDLQAQEPIDIQHMYYSGEAAFAFLKAHEVLGDERNLEAARRLMTHLTGAGWDFFGSRYYYGEEHWTCIAAGEARARVDSPAGRDFCRRWFEFNDRVQYRAGETPWPVSGAYGVGPLLPPRLTPVGSRTEAFVSTYELLDYAGEETTELRALIERGLGMLLRYRWSPGPTYLFASPRSAIGGMPGGPTELAARNDFVQHAGSAFIRWAEVLRREREGQAD